MKVLITGNLGYVGSVVSPVLQGEGHDVSGIDAGFYKNCQLFPAHDAPTVQMDIRDVSATDLAGFDAIVHLAALSNDPTGDLDPALTDDINHTATVHLAEMGRKAGVKRFVFASSCSMYGVAGDTPVNESADFNPQTAYARSKVDSELGLMSLATDAFSPVRLRFSTAYGLSPRLRMDIVANNLTGWAVSSGKVRVMSDGTPWRPLVHVRDMAAAILAALEAPRESIHNEAFNVGRDQDNYQVRDIADTVGSVVPGCAVEYAPGGSPDNRTYRVSFGKVRRLLPEFVPTWSLKPGVQELYEKFVDVGMDGEKFQSRYFTRLKQVRHLMETGVLNAALRRV